MKHDRTTPQVTVEDLFKLKRAERPDADFWLQFEHEMRTKQLAAIVEPRPWWAPFIRVSTRMARYQLPVGATAILALTFLTVREYRLPEASETQWGSMAAETQVVSMPEVSVATVSEAPIATSSGMIEKNEMTAAPTARLASNNESAVQQQVSEQASVPENRYSPAAEAIAANLAAVRASAPELAHLVARVSGVDAIINPRTPSQVVDPLARVESTSSSRRTSRLLASALPARYSSSDSEHESINRVERNLTEDRMYDSISRFGVKADSVAIRF